MESRNAGGSVAGWLPVEARKGRFFRIARDFLTVAILLNGGGGGFGLSGESSGAGNATGATKGLVELPLAGQCLDVAVVRRLVITGGVVAHVTVFAVPEGRIVHRTRFVHPTL